MIYRYSDYAHDDYQDSETVEMLTESYDWPEAVAEHYAEHFKPMYEVKGVFEYDTETDTVKVIEAEVNGVRMVPEV